MVNTIPNSWQYSPEMENLFFFYQASQELLSKDSGDTYQVTVHNSITLCYEIDTIYVFLDNTKQCERFYSKYIPPIIDELISALKDDKILKSCIGSRLESIYAGLERAKKSPTELMRWINLILQACSLEQYALLYKSRIIELITNGTAAKNELLYCINCYYVSLINIGYSSEYLYQCIIRYFDNLAIKITKSNDICKFFDAFTFKNQDIDLYLIADTYIIDNFIEQNPKMKGVFYNKKIEDSDLEHMAESYNGAVEQFYATYLSKKKSKPDLCVIQCNVRSLDPYTALERLEQAFNLVKSLEGYFKHKTDRRIYFDVLQKDNDKYRLIKLRQILPKRPYLSQTFIDDRIRLIIQGNTLSPQAMSSVLEAVSMHFDALNCKNAEIMLRTFWAATEALLYDSHSDGERENVQYSLLHIIQKTYFLKLLRGVYSQLIEAVSKVSLKNLGIASFADFICFFAANQADSTEFKEITKLLSYNPLLRSRLYNLRKDLRDSNHILSKIKNHREKVLWQIARIYRTRNLNTHAGITMPYTEAVLCNLHNYFDYVINFILCKIENGDPVLSMTSLVFEAKIDNDIYMEYLKNNELLSLENYQKLLFGPDQKMFNYKFEVTI